MRVVPLRIEYRVLGIWGLVFGMACGGVYIVAFDESLWGLPLVAVLIAAVVMQLSSWSDRRRMRAAVDAAGARVDTQRDVLWTEAKVQPLILPFAVLALLIDPSLGVALTFLAGLGLQRLYELRWIETYERANGVIVCRVRGTRMKPRYITVRQEASVARRNRVHAQPEAP
jgi:hypothetical protein